MSIINLSEMFNVGFYDRFYYTIKNDINELIDNHNENSEDACVLVNKTGNNNIDKYIKTYHSEHNDFRKLCSSDDINNFKGEVININGKTSDFKININSSIGVDYLNQYKKIYSINFITAEDVVILLKSYSITELKLILDYTNNSSEIPDSFTYNTINNKIVNLKDRLPFTIHRKYKPWVQTIEYIVRGIAGEILTVLILLILLALISLVAEGNFTFINIIFGKTDVNAIQVISGMVLLSPVGIIASMIIFGDGDIYDDYFKFK